MGLQLGLKYQEDGTFRPVFLKLLWSNYFPGPREKVDKEALAGRGVFLTGSIELCAAVPIHLEKIGLLYTPIPSHFPDVHNQEYAWLE